MQAADSVVRAWIEQVWNGADPALAAEAFHPATFLNEGRVSTPGEVAQWHASMRETYPDLHYVIDEIVAAVGRVAVRWTAHGTQHGMLWGLVPPTGKSVSWSGIHLVTVRHGRIVEVWGAANSVAVLQQLGLELKLSAPRPS